jgi:putative tryptophan/tyrosine transport system substrate-binding protein
MDNVSAKPDPVNGRIRCVGLPAGFAADMVARLIAQSLSASQGADSLVMLSSPLIAANVRKEAELAILHNLPVITLFSDFPRAGGLIAYGPNLLGAFRDAGGMVAKVLQGRKPADLPIQRPSKFELVINLKTAKTLGLKISDNLITLADEVIE